MSGCKIVACLALTALVPAFAQTPVNLIHIPGSSVEPIPLAEWEAPNREADGPQLPRISIAEGEAAVARAPDYATRYEAKEYVFPMGYLRVLTFKKDAGPVVHQITFETQLYLLQGSASVGVGCEQVAITTGDAVFLPSGVMRNPDPQEDTVVALFTVSNTAENPKAKVVRGADLPLVEHANIVTFNLFTKLNDSRHLIPPKVTQCRPLI